MQDILTKLLNLVLQYYLIILAAISIMSLLHWSRLKDSGPKILKFVRKTSLFVFSLTVFIPYMKTAVAVNDYLIAALDLNYRLGALLNQYKGSDWADGILSSAAFFTYLGIVVYLWTLEKKASAPPPETVSYTHLTLPTKVSG